MEVPVQPGKCCVCCSGLPATASDALDCRLQALWLENPPKPASSRVPQEGFGQACAAITLAALCKLKVRWAIARGVGTKRGRGTPETHVARCGLYAAADGLGFSCQPVFGGVEQVLIPANKGQGIVQGGCSERSYQISVLVLARQWTPRGC